MHPCDCNKAAIRQSILSLKSRPYGWDGGDALPARPDALHFGNVLFSPDSAFCLAGLSMPEVTLVEDGTIEVAFEHAGRELVLGFVSNWVATFVQVFEDGETTIEGVIRYDKPEDCERFQGLLAWIGAEV